MASRRIRIFGTVQGVYYRAWTLQQAQSLGIRGWVRNRRDGSVEVDAHGDDAAIDALVQRCWQGPSRAHVERINVEESDEQPPPGFRAAPTL